jgi:hypothetical protein
MLQPAIAGGRKPRLSRRLTVDQPDADRPHSRRGRSPAEIPGDSRSLLYSFARLSGRRPTTDDRRPTTDDRRPTTDDRRPLRC